MFQDLDDTIQNLIQDTLAPPELHSADVSFDVPDKAFGPALSLATVDLFLYEVKENRELRDPVPITERLGDIYVQKTPPLRVDCHYLVTTWADPSSIQKTRAEHELLAQALAWLGSFPTIPSRYFQGSLIDQPFPPPTLVAQMDGLKNAGEFWSALGIPPRPYFNLIVTIALDLDRQIEGSLVTTTIANYAQGRNYASREELINIGGTVYDNNGKPLVDAWVLLDPTGRTQVTNEEGRFIFDSVARGNNYTLRTRGPGLTEITRPDLEIPSLTGEYDLRYP